MMRVKNRDGTIIEGLFRNDDGSLVVKNDSELDKYNKQKKIVSEQQETITNMTKELDELKNLVNSLILRIDKTEQ